jgi:hypothetical protein
MSPEMARKIILCVGTAILLLGERAQATSFNPYREARVTDSNGRYYVVVRRREGSKQSFPYGPVTLTIAERRAGSPPIIGASAEPMKFGDYFVPTGDPEIQVRDGDTVHGRVDLDQPPWQIFVSSTGKGIVTIDVYGFNDLGPGVGENDLVIYSIKGEVLHRKARTALFDAETRQRFHRHDGVLFWLGQSWVDEKRDDIVIIGPPTQDEVGPRPILTVSLTSGAVRQGSAEVIDRAICERNPEALSAALDLALEMKLAGNKACLPGILEDEKLALYQRLQAAVLLASMGNRLGAGLLTKTALMGVHEQAGSPKFVHAGEVSYAIEHLPELLGEDALPILSHAAWALERLGEKARPAIPDLEQLARDGDEDAKEFARRALIAINGHPPRR